MSDTKDKIAATWLANPWAPYAAMVVGVVLIVAILPWLMRRLFKGGEEAYDAGKDLAFKVAGNVVDAGAATLGQVSSIVGAPSTELPGQQSITDKIKGLLAGGDSRTWSDLFD